MKRDRGGNEDIRLQRQKEHLRRPIARSARRPAATSRGFSRANTVEGDQYGAGQHKPN